MNCNLTTRAIPVFALMLASILPLTAWPAGDEPVQVARYSTIAPVPRAAQIDPLNAVVTIAFPDQLTTIGEALHHALRRSGYQLASAEAADPAIAMLAEQPLPEVHRRLGPITVARALTTLAGSAWSMVVDPVHRLVSFELARQYAAFGLHNEAGVEDDSPATPSEPDDEGSDCDAYETWTWC